MANTKATQSWRGKWFQANLQESLKKALVAEKICAVDRSDSFYIWNPYGNVPTTAVQSIVGTYAITNWTSTNDNLTVTDEFIYAEHIFDWEKVMQHGDIYASRIDEMTASIAAAIDKSVVNWLVTDGTGTYTTPSGGFTTAANIPIIMSNLLSKVAGYADTYKGLYLVVESTDVPGFVQSGAASGFSFADSWLKNGFMSNYMGVDIYVIRSGTFVTDTLGSKGVVASGHRLFGVKGTCTYAAPRGIQYEEKDVTAKTGKEIVCFGYLGVIVWAAKAVLTVDITLA